MALRDKLEQVANAALNGPAIKNISVKGHEWNVDRVKREDTADGRVIIKGDGSGDNISHRRTWAYDDQVNYSFTVKVDDSGVDIQDIVVSIKEGGVLNTWGAPVVFVIEFWDEIECLGDAIFEDGEIGDCDVLGLLKALWKAVTLDSSNFDVGNTGVDIDDLENQRLSWRETAELMILFIASSVMVREIALRRPSWIEPDNPIKVVAPDFAGQQEVFVGVDDSGPDFGGSRPDSDGVVGGSPTASDDRDSSRTPDAALLQELEAENRRLKDLLAELMLDRSSERGLGRVGSR